MMLLLPLVVLFRDWAKLETKQQRLWQAAMLGVIFILPYARDLLQGRNIGYILPLWYAGVAVAITLATLQLYRLQPASASQQATLARQETYAIRH
jgi:hypothetical protein